MSCSITAGHACAGIGIDVKDIGFPTVAVGGLVAIQHPGARSGFHEGTQGPRSSGVKSHPQTAATDAIDVARTHTQRREVIVRVGGGTEEGGAVADGGVGDGRSAHARWRSLLG